METLGTPLSDHYTTILIRGKGDPRIEPQRNVVFQGTLEIAGGV